MGATPKLEGVSDRELQVRRAAESESSGPTLRITNAPEPLSVDQRRRMRKYLIQMGVRVVCFIAAFVAWTLGAPLIVTGVLVVAAAVLPYFAVVGVNAGRDGDSHDTSFGLRDEAPLLPAASDTSTKGDNSSEH